MEQNRTKLTLLSLVLLLVVGGLGLALARAAHVLSGQVAACFAAVGVLVTLVSYFQMRLLERERLERLEYDELTKAPSASALFNVQEAGQLPAARSRAQFDRIFVPVFTSLLFLGEAAAVFFLWRWLARPSAMPISQPLLPLIAFATFFIIAFIIGRFAVAVARMERQRLLQPVAEAVLGVAYFCALACIGPICAYFEVPQVDRYVALGLVVVLGLMAVETFFTLILEIYRPRVQGRAARLLYDSRVLGLISQPESLFTTAAHALDYQFGFKVSETWVYRTLQQYFPWIVLGEFTLFFLCTSFVVVETGEHALLERFGRPVDGRALLEPGLHLKWPWPVDKIHRYRTDSIQSVTVGFQHEEEAEEREGEIVLWTVSHSQGAADEFNLIVASRESVTNLDAGKKSPPVNLLAASIPVQFQITNLLAWAYQNTEPQALLQKIATREVVRHFVNADLNELLSSGRTATAEALRDRIQQAVDQRQLGARIIMVGLQDIHPPVRVAAEYEKLVGARQSAEAGINQALAYAARTNALAGSQARRTVLNAEADSVRAKTIALARAASFTNQIPAYRAAPSVYSTRAYLQVLGRNAGLTRKYVLATTNTDDVITFNLEDKFERNLLDVNIPAPKK